MMPTSIPRHPRQLLFVACERRCFALARSEIIRAVLNVDDFVPFFPSYISSDVFTLADNSLIVYRKKRYSLK